MGDIERWTQRVGTRAEAALAHLRACRQAVARFLLYDEGHPEAAAAGVQPGCGDL